MKRVAHPGLLGAIALAALAAAIFEVVAHPGLRGIRNLGFGLFLILLFTPVKALVLDRFGAARPYWSSLLANASSMLLGLPFHLPLAPGSKLLTSFAISTVIETAALYAFGASRSLKRCLAMAAYASLIAHTLFAGYLLFSRNTVAGVAVLLAGFALLQAPSFFPRLRERGANAN